MNSTTNLRTTNPRGRPNPLAEPSIDYIRAHRQMAVPRFGLGWPTRPSSSLHIHRRSIRSAGKGDRHRVSSVR
jgi:hypothetical protein